MFHGPCPCEINQMVELAMLELAAAKHCEGFMSLSHLAGANGGEQARVPIDLASLASGLVSTDGKVANAKTGPTKPPSNGRPWANLSEYLQQHLPAAGDFDKLVPHSEPSTGRLEPHKEAINKGWHFGNVSSPEVAPATCFPLFSLLSGNLSHGCLIHLPLT